MTSPVSPPAKPTVPPYPPLGSPTFNQDAYTYGSSMPGVVDGIDALAQSAFVNAASADESAGAAQQAAGVAATAADAAMGAANFKGLWSSLSGPLNKPATVKHEGRFWLLLNNLPDVAASEPGVSSDWTSMDAGDLVQEVSTPGTVDMLPGVLYVIKASGVTLVAPVTLVAGDVLMVTGAIKGTYLTDWNGHTVKGDTQTVPMAIPPYRGFRVTYSGSTLA